MNESNAAYSLVSRVKSDRLLVRDNEERYTALQLAEADDATLLAALAQHPELLQRPVVVDGERVLVARPPELLDAFLDA